MYRASGSSYPPMSTFPPVKICIYIPDSMTCQNSPCSIFTKTNCSNIYFILTYHNLSGEFQNEYRFVVVFSPQLSCFYRSFMSVSFIFLKPDLFVQEKNTKPVATERKIFKARSILPHPVISIYNEPPLRIEDMARQTSDIIHRSIFCRKKKSKETKVSFENIFPRWLTLIPCSGVQKVNHCK